MTLTEFAKLVQKMRALQARYFREKKKHPFADHTAALAECKRAEAVVDNVIDEILFTTPSLPGMGDDPPPRIEDLDRPPRAKYSG